MSKITMGKIAAAVSVIVVAGFGGTIASGQNSFAPNELIIAEAADNTGNTDAILPIQNITANEAFVFDDAGDSEEIPAPAPIFFPPFERDMSSLADTRRFGSIAEEAKALTEAANDDANNPADVLKEVEDIEKKLENQLRVHNLNASTISVSSLKVTWDKSELENVSYLVEVHTNAIFANNITVVPKGDNVCYITGLRENSDYLITVTPIYRGEKYEKSKGTCLGKTEKVTVVQLYEYEYGKTNCFAGERASGLTRMPSSGAIKGSICDPVTGTGIRRNSYGDYCCAMGLWYGRVGDRFLVELENGIQFTVQICDSKGWADDADGDGINDGRFHWFGGKGKGKCIIEFIWDDGNLPSRVRRSGSWGVQNWNGLDLTSNIVGIKKIQYGDTITY